MFLWDIDRSEPVRLLPPCEKTFQRYADILQIDDSDVGHIFVSYDSDVVVYDINGRIVGSVPFPIPSDTESRANLDDIFVAKGVPLLATSLCIVPRFTRSPVNLLFLVGYSDATIRLWTLTPSLQGVGASIATDNNGFLNGLLISTRSLLQELCKHIGHAPVHTIEDTNYLVNMLSPKVTYLKISRDMKKIIIVISFVEMTFSTMNPTNPCVFTIANDRSNQR